MGSVYILENSLDPVVYIYVGFALGAAECDLCTKEFSGESIIELISYSNSLNLTTFDRQKAMESDLHLVGSKTRFMLFA